MQYDDERVLFKSIQCDAPVSGPAQKSVRCISRLRSLLEDSRTSGFEGCRVPSPVAWMGYSCGCWLGQDSWILQKISAAGQCSTNMQTRIEAAAGKYELRTFWGCVRCRIAHDCYCDRLWVRVPRGGRWGGGDLDDAQVVVAFLQP
jgi:hypothetical protein